MEVIIQLKTYHTTYGYRCMFKGKNIYRKNIHEKTNKRKATLYVAIVFFILRKDI